MVRCAASVVSEHASRVTIVHDHRGIVSLRQLDDPIEFREVAIHGEDSVRRDQAKAIGCCVAQLGFQVRHIGVRVAEPGGLAEPDAVDQAGVVQGVADDGVLLAEEHLKESAVGVEARTI
jgi:hypothetical protein